MAAPSLSLRRLEGERQLDKPTNVPLRLLCLCLGLGSGIIAVVGRGMITIVQGVIGCMFAVDGYWAAFKTKFAPIFASISVGVAIIHLQTTTEYCSTAQNEEKESCENDVTDFALSLLIGGVAFFVVTFLMTLVFEHQMHEWRSATSRREAQR